MKLSHLLEAEQTHGYVKQEDMIRAILDDIRGFDEYSDWVIGHDGVVEESPDAGGINIEIPAKWNAIRVKFGEFPNADYRLVKCQLGTLQNSPTAVNRFIIQGGIKLASLRGGPEHVEEYMTLVDATLSSLAGAPKTIGGSVHSGKVVLREMRNLSSLAGLEHLHLRELDIQACSGLKTFDGMPSKIEHNVFLDDLENLEAVRFPHHVSMGQNGALFIGASLVSKLSPTLVTVPGLMTIDWLSSSVGFRDDIINIYNRYLKLPKTTRTYLQLQQELIDKDLDWLAEL